MGGIVGAGLAFSLAAAGMQGCHSPVDTFVNYTSAGPNQSSAATGGSNVVSSSGNGGMGGEGGGGIVACDDPEDYFEAVVEERMVAECAGAGCHSSGQFGFLLPQQEYGTITSYRTTVAAIGLNLLQKEYLQSPLLTWPESGEHSGEGWDKNDVRVGLLPDVEAWLACEAPFIPEPSFKQVGPFEVKPGLNVFPLDAVDGPDLAFDGSAMIFYAEEHGTPVSLLEMAQLQIYPTQDRGIRIKDPVFIINENPEGNCDLVDPEDGFPDNSLSGGEAEIFTVPGEIIDIEDIERLLLGTGELLLSNWSENACLTVRFTEMTLLFADVDGNTFEPCTEVPRFQAATEALELDIGVGDGNGPAMCADVCHAGADGPAQAAMDLEYLTDSPPDYEFACAVMKSFITPANPDQSLIITHTEPGSGGTHTEFQFAGNGSAHGIFKDGMTDWICHEDSPDGVDGCNMGSGGAGGGG